MNAQVLALLFKPSAGQLRVIALPAIAFAVVTALVLAVIGGAQKFWTWTDADAGLYQALAAIALVLLVVPLAALGAAAARLSAKRRDERLSTLRLLGVSPGGVILATVLESTAIAAVGAITGFLGYLLLAPALGMIPFRGEQLGLLAVLLSPTNIVLVLVCVIALAAVSAILGLRQVVISPLGVRTRTQAPRTHWIRAVIAVTVIAGAIITMQVFPGADTFLVTVAVIGALFAVSMAVLNVIGPWLLSVHARAGLRRAKNPQRLLAARFVLESPKSAWRQVSGVAMASFIAVFAGTGVSMIDTMTGVDAQANVALAADVRTGLIITLLGSFLMVAASVGINQASMIFDQRELHHSLHALGVELETVDSARTRAVMSPLLLTALGSAACATVLMLPLIGIALITAPLSLIVIATVIAAGISIVWLSTRATLQLLGKAFQPA